MFPGFSAADFDCYEPRKWKSNAFNRERLEVKQRLLTLAREVSPSITSTDGAPLFIEASVEHPAIWNHKQVDAQHVFFSRNEAARKELDLFIDRQKPISSLLDDPTPQRNHLFLALSLNHEGLELSLKLHPDARVDRQNLERKIEDHFECDHLLSLINTLPRDFTIGVSPDRDPTSSLTMDALRSIVEKLGAPAQQGPLGALSLPGQAPQARLFCISQPLPREKALAQDLPAWARAGLSHLLPIYRFIAWSRDNDFVSMRQVLDKEKVVKRQRGLGKNDNVRIIRGMFAGKNGVVQEVDARGGLKVLVGKMIVKIDAADVERPG